MEPQAASAFEEGITFLFAFSLFLGVYYDLDDLSHFSVRQIVLSKVHITPLSTLEDIVCVTNKQR